MAKDKKVTCGVCNLIHADNTAYLTHECSVTGFVPTDPRHLGRRFIMQSKQALKRGGSLNATRKNELDALIETSREAKTDEKISHARVENKGVAPQTA